YRLSTPDYRLPTTDYRLPTTDYYRLSTTSYGLSRHRDAARHPGWRAVRNERNFDRRGPMRDKRRRRWNRMRCDRVTIRAREHAERVPRHGGPASRAVSGREHRVTI